MSTQTRAPSRTGELVAGYIRQLPPSDTAGDIVRLLRRNKFPILALDADKLPRTLVESEEFRAAVDEDREWLDTQRSEFQQVREAWQQRGIRGIFIKTACIPPSFPYRSDNLDILVPEEQDADAKDALRQLGFIELRNIEEPKKYLFRKFSGGRSVCAVHLHHWAGWNVNFFEEELLRERGRVAPDDDIVEAPSAEDAVLINLAHAYYENKRFDLHDLEKMRSAWLEGIDWDYLPEVPKRSGWYDGFLMGMLMASHFETKLTGASTIPERYRRHWESELREFPKVYRHYRRLLIRPVTMPFKVSFLFSKLLYYEKIQRDTHDPLPARFSNTVRTLVWGFKLKSGIRPQRSMLVTFSGVDGSGKTGQAKALMDVLKLTEIKAYYHWSRAGSSPAMRLISKLLGLVTGRRTGGPSPDSTGQLKIGRRSGALQALWAWVVVLDLAARVNFRLRPRLLLGSLGLGRVIVCDRYLADAAAEIEQRLSSRSPAVRAALRFLRFASPRPDLAYLLDVPEEVAQQRHDLPLSRDVLRAHRESYLDAAKSSMRGTLVIDGTRAMTDIADGIARDVLTHFEARYETWLNGLMLSNPGQRNPQPNAGG